MEVIILSAKGSKFSAKGNNNTTVPIKQRLGQPCNLLTKVVTLQLPDKVNNLWQCVFSAKLLGCKFSANLHTIHVKDATEFLQAGYTKMYALRFITDGAFKLHMDPTKPTFIKSLASAIKVLKMEAKHKLETNF